MRVPQNLMTDFSSEAMKVRRHWDCMFKALKDKKLFTAKLYFKNESKLRTF